jgi:hypothetical protein
MFGGRRGDYILSQYDIHLSVFGIVFILPPRSIGDASIELLGDLNLRTFCSKVFKTPPRPTRSSFSVSTSCIYGVCSELVQS